MDDSISVIIVSFNTRELTLRCLDAVCATAPFGTDVCVVDNASTDGSPQALLDYGAKAALHVRVLLLCKNLGFGTANNIGVRASRGRFIALVNSDAFVHPCALETLRRYLASHGRVGVAGAHLRNADGSFQESRFPFPSPARAWFENAGLAGLKRLLPGTSFQPGAAGWVSGACLMVRRDVWEQSGGFDEDFFLYAEETDWQQRVRRFGHHIHWVADAHATHLGGASGGNMREGVRQLFYEGADRYILKHHGFTGAVLFRAATIFGAVVRWAIPWRSGSRDRKSCGWIIRRQIFSRFPVPGCLTGSQGEKVAKQL